MEENCRDLQPDCSAPDSDAFRFSDVWRRLAAYRILPTVRGLAVLSMPQP